MPLTLLHEAFNVFSVNLGIATSIASCTLLLHSKGIVLAIIVFQVLHDSVFLSLSIAVIIRLVFPSSIFEHMYVPDHCVEAPVGFIG